MRYFSFDDYDLVITWSESKIIDYYWDHWSSVMLKRGYSPAITEQNCIDEFVVVYWAWEVFPSPAPSGWDELTNVR